MILRSLKNFMIKMEYDRINGKKPPQNDTSAKLVQMNDIKTKKEQIDYDRQRIKTNLEKIKTGDLPNINRNRSDLLKMLEKMRNYSSYQSANPLLRYGLDNTKSIMDSSSSKIRSLVVNIFFVYK